MISTRKSRHEHFIRANSQVVRNINRAMILNFIREHQPISRASIARLTKLNKSTVSSIVSSLLREELVAEEVDKTPTVGRTPINLQLRRGRNLYGAISFDSATTRIAVIDVDGTIMHTDKMKSDGSKPEDFIVGCLNMLKQLRVRHNLPQLKGIGVSVAGIVDSLQSRVVFAPNLGWENINLGDILAKHCPDIPVTAVDNDAKAAALAELVFGRHNINLSNFVFLSVGRGIGTGIVIDKRILTGESHLAGEFGHMVLFDGGEPCTCGNQGCWEAYASDRATVKRYAAARKLDSAAAGRLSIDDIIMAARSGEPQAMEELKVTGKYLGIGIANVIKAVDPGSIIVGGHVTRVWDLISEEVVDSARKRSFFRGESGTAILPTSLTARPSLLGAAALAQRKFFGDVRVTV